jgi:predicted nucleic acid-binding Zn ribbon protein
MDERKRISNQSTLGEVIDKLMKAYGLDGRMKEMEIINKWEDMMGRAVSARTKKIFIQNQVLHLSLDSSVMRDELMQGKSVIIQRVNETAGCVMIRDVWFS